MNKGKSAIKVQYEEKNLEFILNNRELGNAVISNEMIYNILSKDERYQENNGAHFKSSDIVLCIEIFLHLEETLMLH